MTFLLKTDVNVPSKYDPTFLAGPDPDPALKQRLTQGDKLQN
jgi:hypothetical protein